jgi:hypothetical protein
MSGTQGAALEEAYSRDHQFTSLCRSILRWPSQVLVSCLDRGIHARSDSPGGIVTGLSLGIARCTTLRLISLRVGNDDFATTEETRV